MSAELELMFTTATKSLFLDFLQIVITDGIISSLNFKRKFKGFSVNMSMCFLIQVKAYCCYFHFHACLLLLDIYVQ